MEENKIELNHPGDFSPYGGADKSHLTSNERVNGERVHYFSQCGSGPKGFGVHVFRQVGVGGRATYVWYNGNGPLLAGRGDLDLDADGTLQVNGSWSDADKDAVAFAVPGFVPFAAEPPDLNLLTALVDDLRARIAVLELRAGVLPSELIPLPALSELPNFGKPYGSDAELFSKDWTYLRFNKLTAAVMRLIAVAAQLRGE